MTVTALRGRLSTEPLAVDREINPTSSSEVEAYLADTLAALRDAGRRIGMSGLRRLYSRWLKSPQAESDFGAYVLAYADPTGETATARALRDEIRRGQQ